MFFRERMRCKRTEWRGFRNLAVQRIEWGEGLHLLVGPNGAGKTNALEALSLMTGWGPFPGRKTSQMRTWGKDEKAYLSGEFEGEERVVSAAVVGRATQLGCNGKRCGAADLRPRVPSLAFLPEDLALVEGSPGIRRRFLDQLCALLLPLYALKLHEYKRALRSRVILLRQGKNVGLTARVLAPLAGWLWSSREMAVRLLVEGLSAMHALLPAEVSLVFSRGGCAGEGNPIEEYWKSLALLEKRERLVGSPLVGPHRDDLFLGVEEQAASVVLSRGQRRRLAVALMLAAGYAVERRLRRCPLLLLDEVAAELDGEGRGLLFSSLAATGWQIFAATAEGTPYEWPGKEWRVHEGHISPLK